MSTVMYCYKVKKDDLWDWFDMARSFYNEHGFIVPIVLKQENLGDLYSDDIKLIIENQNVTLQVFDFDTHWLFRVLESGYFFSNNFERLSFGHLEAVFYDNRSDHLPEEEGNEEIAEKVDNLISLNHYFIIPLIDRTYLVDLWWKDKYGIA